MSKHSSKHLSAQSGLLLGWIPKKSGGIKGIILKVGAQTLKLKLKKDLRKTVQTQFSVGQWLVVQGEFNSKKGKVHRLSPSKVPADASPKAGKSEQNQLSLVKTARRSSSKKSNLKQKVQVAVCQRSSCARRGSRKVLRALQKSVEAHQLQQQIDVVPAKCLGQCKAGPAVVATPGKRKFRNVRPCEVGQLIVQELCSS